MGEARQEQARSTTGHRHDGRVTSRWRHRPRVVTLAALCFSACLASSAQAGNAAQTVGDRVAQLGEQIRTEEAILEEMRREAVSIFESLEVAEAVRRQLDEAVAQARAEEKAAAARLLATHADLAATRDAYLAQLDLLSPRLRAMQKLAGRDRSSLLFSARSFSQFLRRRKALGRVLDADLRWLGRAQAALDELQARERALGLEEARHREKVRETLAREALARQQRDGLSRLHRRLLDERALRQKTLAELEEAQKKLRDYLSASDAGASRTPATGGGLEPPDLFAVMNKGALALPVEGFIEVGFGRIVNPKFNTVTFQNGVDIRAPLGAPIRAVARGKVVHAAPFRGYGNLVILDHGDGYHSLYAHLAEIACEVGGSLDAGEVLGAVGETGSLKGAYLYFELRRRGKPIDPKEWFGGGP